MKQISDALKEFDGVEVPPIEPCDLESLEDEAVEDEKDSKSEN